MMRTFSLKCKVITPLFMGGANQQAELRTQSINGLLRWWFRIAGGSIEDEKRLFGWAGEKSNQGLVRIFIKNFDELQKNKFSKDFDNEGRVRQDKGINYIGFSLDQRFNEKQDKPRREYIKENQTFEMSISFHPKANEEDIKKFFCALWLAFNLGNFGSRSRRGFGAIRIKEIKIEKIKEDGKEDYEYITNNCYGLSFAPSGDLGTWINKNLNEIKKVLNQPRKDIPNLFDNFEIYQIQKDNFSNWKNWIAQVQEGRQGKYLKNSWGGNNVSDWKDLLDFMGFLLMAYRSYRPPDYDNAKKILRGNNLNTPTFERAIFGIPLNFYFSSLNRGSMVHLKLGNDNLRRASPLMIKIIQSESGYEGLFIVMKSTFMPANSRLVFSNESINLPEENIWEALDGFIESLERHNLIDKIYPKEV
ncbi:MAG: type III-B CRISPR module RAMP protein Cmr1 [Candidatus Hydrothermia bacterium]|jgi:CRISPR-associated protein Cmr1